MTLSAGMRLGPYEIVGPVGAGGMGEVYHARDTRLGRDVAVKVLPGGVSHTPERLHRFEQEARLAGSLNHPNVLTLFDVGAHDGAPYLVTELLEGRSLREVLAAGPLPPRKATEYAQQAARGLAAAHERGVVHRDLKPANVFVTKDGRLKILDFGLAKLTQADPATAGSQFSTDTAEGKVVGTIGYMAPEQVRGHAVDSRSDIFALGAVVYEMLSGRRAFTGDTAADTMTAILTKDPDDLSRPGILVPACLERIVRRCLEKDPAERFQSAKDVAFALEAEGGTGQTAPVTAPAAPRRRWLRWAATVALMALAAAAGAWFSRRPWERPLPRFTQLTFRRGTILSARFTADGNTVVYSALWDGKPPEIFTRRLDQPESASLGLPPAMLLSVSSRGELAILVAPPGERGAWWQGTLARTPLSGGAIRPILEDVVSADWSPDGRELAVIRQVKGVYQLEYPIGTVLSRPLPVRVGEFVRVSPDGSGVAVPSGGEGVLIVNRARAGNVLRLPPTQSFAWVPRGRGLLAVAGDNLQHRTVWHLRMDGTRNEILDIPGTLVLHDLSRDGRLLVHHGFERVGLRAKAPGESAERELGVYAASRARGLSADGSQLLLQENSATAPMTFLRPTRGGFPVRLGDWGAQGISLDGQWVLARTSVSGRSGLSLVPTGPGEPIPLPSERLTGFPGAFHVEARAVGFLAAEPERPTRSFWIDLPAGRPRAVTPEGVVAVRGLRPDGSVLGVGVDGSLALYTLAGGDPRALPWRLQPGPIGSVWHALQVSADGRFVYMREGCSPARVDRVEILTGRRVPWRTLDLGDRAGIGAIYPPYITPDGTTYAYSYGEWLQDLHLVEGLRY